MSYSYPRTRTTSYSYSTRKAPRSVTKVYTTKMKPMRPIYPKKSRRVARPIATVVDRSQQGIQNTFVPALTRARYFGKCRYGSAQLNFTAASGLVNTYLFSANGIYDPDITATGQTAAGFAQLMSLYEHYTVYRSTISVIFTNNSTAPAMVAISLEPDTTSSTDPSNVLELPYSQIVQLEPASSYGASKTIKLQANMSKYFGVPVTKGSELYRGTISANPPEQAYYHCKVFAVKGGSADVYMTVKIEYEAMFTEPRELSASLNDAIKNLVLEDINKSDIKEEPVDVKKSEPVPPSSGILSGIFS